MFKKMSSKRNNQIKQSPGVVTHTHNSNAGGIWDKLANRRDWTHEPQVQQETLSQYSKVNNSEE